jgi:hypothetical protein
MKKKILDPSELRVDSFEPSPALGASSMATQAGEPTCGTCGASPPRVDMDNGAFRTILKCCV